MSACEFWLKTNHKSGLKPYLDYEGEVIESHLVIYTLYFTFISAIIRPSPLFLHVARDELAVYSPRWQPANSKITENQEKR